MRNQSTRKQKRQSGFRFLILGICLALAVMLPSVALGQVNINTIPGSTFGLGTADLLSTVIRIVQWALGILGLIAVIIIMYGGFLWLTARGREEQVAKAKRVLTQAVIGLIIILLAWAIVAFIVNSVTNATTGAAISCTPNQPYPYPVCQRCNAAGDGTFPDPTIAGCSGGGPLNNFYSTWTIPQDTTPTVTGVSLCSVVGAGFQGSPEPWIDPATVTDTNITITDSGGNQVAGTYMPPPPNLPVRVNWFEFDPTDDYLPNETYTVSLGGSVQSTAGIGASPRTWQFETGVTSDATPPTVLDWSPRTPACLQPQITVVFNESMAPSSFVPSNFTITPNPTGVSIVSLFATTTNVDGDTVVATLSGPLQGNTTYTITISADTSTGFRDTCGNGLDCGNGTDICTSNTVSDGDPADNFSWTFLTDDTTEVNCDPLITSIDPGGMYSNDGTDSITIQGENFTAGADLVLFSNTGWGTQIDASNTSGVASRCFNSEFLPERVVPDASIACIQSWQDNAIEVVVPSGPLNGVGTGATAGPLTVRTGGAIFSAAANGFTQLNSPHIRGVSPATGGEGQYVTLLGSGFTATPGEIWLRRDDGYEIQATTCDTSAWQDNQIVIKIPTGTNFVVNDVIHIQVDTLAGNPNGNDRSNLATFVFNGAAPTPGICTAAPSCHNGPGQTIALTGEFFTNVNAGTYAALTPSPPALYGGTPLVSSDTQMTLTSPATLPQDSFAVIVQDGTGASNAISYAVPCDPAPYVVMNNQCAPPGTLPLPNPYPDTEEICTNLDQIYVEYSEDMVQADLTQANMDLNECTGNKTGCTTRIGPNSSNVDASVPITWGRYFVTAGSLNPDTWYQFVVPATTSSSAGVDIGTDTVWYFKTRADATPCEADVLSLSVTNYAPGVYNDPFTSHPNTIEYTGSPLTNSCQIITAPGTWNWTVTDTAEAECSGGTCAAANTQDVDTVLYDPLVDDGLTSVQATLGSLSAEKPLNVQLNYCQSNADCTCNGNPGVCNLAAQKCEPYVESVMQPSGPKDTLVSVSGCFFGVTPGQVEFIDQALPNASLLGINLCTLPTWTNTDIQIGTPDFPLGTITDVNVRSFIGPGQFLDSSTRGIFTYADTCGGLIPPSVCSIFPTQTGEGTGIQISGLNLPNGSGASDDVVYAPGLSSPTIGWTSSTSMTSIVPVGAITVNDNVVVQKDYGAGTCLSNPMDLQVSCTTNGECGTGCCIANACVDNLLCQSISAGTQCRIPSNPDMSCQAGQTTDPLGNLKCISNTGFTEAKNPPPPPLGSQCQFCCDPDYNNDGVYFVPGDHDINGAGLSCTPLPLSSTSDATCRSATDDPTQQRGLFCGCSSDLQCGSGTGCAIVNDPNRCCRAEPSFDSATPPTGTPLSCQNQVFEFTFFTGGAGVVMDPASINGSTITIEDGSGTAIPGNIVYMPTGFQFHPVAPYLAKGSSITISVSTGVQNSYGINIAGPVSETWTIAAGADLCRVDKVDVEYFNNSTSLWSMGPLFVRCALNGCVSDQALFITPGAQTPWRATARDNNNNTISGLTFNWDESTNNSIFNLTHVLGLPFTPPCPNGGTSFGCYSTAASTNGTGTFTVTASGPGLGSATGTGTEVNFLCQKPWPDPATAAAPYNTWPFRDADNRYHFSTFYCRDGGLPELRLGNVLNPPATSPLVTDPGFSIPNVDDILRQYLFIVTDDAGNRIGRDAIGMIIMENELHLPPDLWYKRTFPEESQAGQLLEVNGFPAWRVGSTTYIAATNVDTSVAGLDVCSGPGTKCQGGVMYSNIYIISHSNAPTEQTVAIYNNFLQNLKFNTNVADAQHQRIRNDVKRIHSITRMAIALSDYKKTRGNYPALPAGTFLGGMTVSSWPSWNETLATTLGVSLQSDPTNTMSGCPAPFDPTTCWDDDAKQYNVGTDSYVFQYNLFGTSNVANIFARLEYMGNGSWRTVPGSSDVLTGVCPVAQNPLWSSAQCDTNFNYTTTSGEFETLVTTYQTVGAIDNDPPENLSMSGFNPPIDGARTITATATDDRPTDRGMDRVEFFYKATTEALWTPSATDFDETDGWVWNFEPSATPAGNYDFRMRAFDKAGNYDDITVNNIAIAQILLDLEAPQISGFAVGPVTTTMENVATIAAPGITSASSGSVLYVNYWGTPATIERCNDQLTSCSTIVTAPDNPIPPANDTARQDYYWVGEDKARPSEFLVTYTPLDVPASSYPPRKVQRFSKNMSAGDSPIAEYDMRNATHVVGLPNGNLAVATNFDTVRIFDPANAVYNPVAGQNTQLASVYVAGTIKGLEADSVGNIYVSAGSNVYKYNSSLALVATSPALNDPYGVHAATDRIFVAEQGARQVRALDTSLSQIIETYTGFGAVNGPVDVIEKNGDVYAAYENTLQKFSPVREAVGNVTLSVDAFDNVAITKVEFYWNTSKIAEVTTGNPYTYSWDTNTISDGDYTIYAVAFDAAGNTTITKQSIGIRNGNDTIHPSVYISDPSNGDTVSSVVQVRAVASDNQGIQDVEFQVNGVTWDDTLNPTFPNPDSSGPYAWAWDSNRDATGASLPNGNVQLTAVATDINGNQNSDTITVTVNNTAGGIPSAWFIHPANNDIFGPGQFEIYATDPDGTIDHVELFNSTTGDHYDSETTPVNSIYYLDWPPTSLFSTQPADGVYQLHVIAQDNIGNRSQASAPGATINVTIDTVAPAITAFAPPGGTVLTGTESFSASATDLNGIDKIEIYLREISASGIPQIIGTCDDPNPQSPYTCNISFDTTTVADGFYHSIVVAYDEAGNTTSLARLNLEVDNGTSGPTVPVVTAPEDLVVGSDNIYKINSGSSTWSTVQTLASGQEARNIRNTSTGLYAVTTNPGQVYRSTDGGNTWTQLTIPATILEVYDVVENNSSLFIATSPNRIVYRSDDNGATWVSAGSVPASGSGGQVFALESISGTLYASTDLVAYWTGGTSWTNTGYPSSGDPVNDMELHGTEVFAGSGGATPLVHSRSTSGGSWLPHGSPGSGVLYTLLSTGPDLYAGTSQGIFSRFNSATNSWSTISTVPSPTLYIGRLIESNSIIYAGSSDGVYSTSDQGVTWSRVGTTIGFSFGVVAPSSAPSTPDTTPPTDPAISLSPEYVGAGRHYSTTNANSFNATGQVFLEAVSDDSGTGIAYIDILVNGSLVDPNGDGYTCLASQLTGGNTCRVQWTAAAAGAYTISSNSQDNAGNPSANTVSINATIDNSNPLVQITSPLPNYYVGGTAFIQFNASDGSSGSGVQSVSGYYSPGLVLIGTDSAAAWSISWNTIGLADGPYTLTSQATDFVGNTGSGVTDPVPVNVNNTSGINCGTSICSGSTLCCSTTCYNPSTHQCCRGSVIPDTTICNIVQPS